MDIEGQKQYQSEDEDDEQKQDDQTNYFLQCKVCREQYDEQMKKPFILPCGHTFCSFCIDNLNQDGIVICPLDKKKSAIQDSLILNYAIIEALNESSTQNLDVLPCKIHPKEIMKFYCEDDEKLICQECLIESHIGHKIKPADEYIDLKKLKFNAKKFLSGLQNNEQIIIQHKEEIQEEYSDHQSEIYKCKERMEEAFNQTFIKSIQEIDNRIQELNNKSSNKLKQIQSLQQESQELSKIIEESKNEKEIIQEVLFQKLSIIQRRKN